MLKIDILPKSFCRDFVQTRENYLQITMYMALVLGFKPFMDDWVPKKRLSEFKRVCKKYGIYVKEDVIFVPVAKDDIKGDILGKEKITTTSGFAFPLETDIDGAVHVFLSKNMKILSAGMWYPLIVKDRILKQPLADSLRYGRYLGYPDCCVRFFRKYNNWNKYSFLYEIYKNSSHVEKYHFYCNPFFKDAVYSYISHMPCSFQCKKTIRLAASLRKEIKKREPEFAESIDCHLKMPLLVFHERKFYAFEGKLTEKNTISYSKVYFSDADDSQNIYQKTLSKGNKLTVSGRDVVIYKNKDIVDTIKVLFKNFSSEYPYVIQFL